MLASMLTEERIVLDLNTESKEATLRRMAQLLSSPTGEPSSSAIFETLNAREALGSTGIGHGVAVPHGRMQGLTESRAAVAIHKAGVDFDAVDGLPVSIVIGILGGVDSHREHLTVLAQLSRKLRDERTRTRLTEATTPKEVFGILSH